MTIHTRGFDLLKALGFEAPSWQDLTMVLGILIVVAALGGMGWSLWERSQHDPWLRLLARARQRLARCARTTASGGTRSLLSRQPCHRHAARGLDEADIGDLGHLDEDAAGRAQRQRRQEHRELGQRALVRRHQVVGTPTGCATFGARAASLERGVHGVFIVHQVKACLTLLAVFRLSRLG